MKAALRLWTEAMKTVVCLLAFALVLGQAACLKAFESVSPDGQYQVAKVGFSLQLLGPTGPPLLILDIDATDSFTDHLEASWSRDSRRVAVVVDAQRKSTVYAAWRSESGWQKATQRDIGLPDLEALTRQNGPLVSEQRRLGDWASEDKITVHGFLVFQNRKVVTYGYDLTVAPAQNGGGAQPGRLVAGNYRTP